jgi:hypothetical protein
MIASIYMLEGGGKRWSASRGRRGCISTNSMMRKIVEIKLKNASAMNAGDDEDDEEGDFN